MLTAILLTAQVLGASVVPALSAAVVEARMNEAEQLYTNLEYEELIRVVSDVIDAKVVEEETKTRAYFLQGAALAVIGATVEAEIPFRLLLRIDPNYELDESTSPRIVAVFSKVSLEEQAMQASLEGIAMARILQEMSIRGSNPTDAQGGRPIGFRYRVTDPRGLVESFFLHFRKAGTPHYSSLALIQDRNGSWLGTIPGEWSESQFDYKLQYHLVTKDDRDRKLQTLGTPYEPLGLDVRAGTVESVLPFYERPWFWTVAGLAASALVGTTGYLLYERSTPQDGAAVLVLD